MKMPLRRALLVSALLLPLPAFAADTGPVAALRSFFTDVTKSDYADAWAAFTSRSKQGIVNSVADSEHLDPTKVRKLFDTNDPSIQAGFWENFKNSSQSGKFVEFAMAAGGPLKGSDDSVVITLPNGNTVALQMFHEGKGWKVGWMETFFPDNKVPVPAS